MTCLNRCRAYRPASHGPCAEPTLKVALTLVAAGVRVTTWIVLTRARCRNRS